MVGTDNSTELWRHPEFYYFIVIWNPGNATTYACFAETRTVAKAFIKLGLKRHHSVGILGFNSPEWFLADLGAVFAGGIATGIYPTNSTEACKFIAENCRANIFVVEDEKQLEKIYSVKDQLPGWNIKLYILDLALYLSLSFIFKLELYI